MNQSHPIRILLVDDDPLILFTLEKVILQQRDQLVVAGVRNGQEALAFLQHNHVDVILLDIQMPYMSGIDCLQQIRKLYPAIVVILLTSFDEEHYIIEGLARGARSYLLKTATFEYLDQYIRDAINGTFVMPSHIATKLAIFLQQSIDLSKKSLSPLFFQTYELTRTEQQIAKFLAKRLSNTEIAEQLGVQSGTIRNHLVTIFSKLHVQNRQEAILFIESHLV
jgi:DNA-binding NarL/FixJ family response regulator